MEVKYQIEGMDCANCALTLERSISQLKGVIAVQVNFPLATLHASGDFDPQVLAARVHALGYQVVVETQPTKLPGRQVAPDGIRGFLRYLFSSRYTTVALVAAFLLLLSGGLSLFVELPWVSGVQKTLHFLVVGVIGLPIGRKGLRAWWVGKQITIDLLMSIATIGALLIGETGEAATVILLFAFGEALEGYSAERARRSLQSLLALKPEQASALRPCLDCAEHLGQGDYSGGPCPYCGQHETKLPVDQVLVGDIILVRPGERIPVDGKILSGESTINQASVTGESLPVQRGPGDQVFAGTLNGEAALEIEASALAQDSTISRIVRLVEEAQNRRAPIERFVDRFARWYTPTVVLIAAGLAIIPPLLFGAPFLDPPDGARGWLYRALAMLIVACPCALVISTPVTVVSALTSLARRGVLVKGGIYLDALARIRVFAFDKTGTLTWGRPTVVQTQAQECLPGEDRCAACDEMLALAAAVESRSEHPLAQAILFESNHRQLTHRYPAAQAVTALVGRGVQGQVNGLNIMVSSHAYSHEALNEHETLHDQIEQAEAQGQTVMLVSREEQVLGFVGVTDQLRPSSQGALQALKNLDPTAHFVLLTGDHLAVAEKIAQRIGGLDEIRAGLLPEEKLVAVKQLEKEYGQVAMLGDGVNDAPALAAATVGIALGGASSAQAMETADVVLMQDDLSHLPDAVATSRRTRQVIWQNIAFSLVIKGLFLALTLPGWATLWMAVFADMGASLLVTLNGMRLLSRPHRFVPG